jgi:hypothetical protein
MRFYLGYVLPCRCQDGTAAILKLSRDTHGAEEQAIALSAWAPQYRFSNTSCFGSKMSHTVNGRHNLIGREVMDHVARSRNSDKLALG